MQNFGNSIGIQATKSKNKVETGKKTLARATFFHEGKDEYPNRK